MKNSVSQKIDKGKHHWSSLFASLYLREKLLLIFTLLLLFIPLVFLSFGFLNFFTHKIPEKGGIYTEAMIAQPVSINPLYAPSSITDRSISYLVYSGLTRIDEKGNPQADLAEKWEISEDKKQYKFTIRKNAFWHDGEPVLSGDVLFTISVIQDPDYLGPLRGQFKDIEMTSTDEYSVNFKLPKEDANFLEKLSVGVLPQHIWGQYPVADMPYAEANLKPIGSGLFKFKELMADEEDQIVSYSLERNDAYYEQVSYLDSLIFKFYKSEDEILQAINKKEIDGTQEISSTSFREIERLDRMRIYAYPTLSYKAVFPNFNKNELLKNKDLRIIMDKVIDRNKLSLENLYGLARPIFGLFPKSMEDYNYEEELARAKERMAKLAKDANKDGILEIGNKSLEFNLSAIDNQESRIVSERLQEDFLKIGIKLNLVLVDSKVFERDVIQPRNYELVLVGQNYGENMTLYPYWHSSKWKSPGLNLSSISSKRVDALLENLLVQGSKKEREEYYETIGSILYDDKYAFFLFQPVYNFATETRIKGIKKEYLLYPEDRFRNINSWYINNRLILN